MLIFNAQTSKMSKKSCKIVKTCHILRFQKFYFLNACLNVKSFSYCNLSNYILVRNIEDMHFEKFILPYSTFCYCSDVSM